MPGSTPELGFPYAAGSDPLGDGATAIQNLAEALEDYLHPYAKLARTAVQVTASGAATMVLWDVAASDMSPAFSLVNGGSGDFDTLQYDGPDGWFVWRYGLEHSGAGGGAGIHSGLFRRSASAVSGSDDYVYRQLDNPGGFPVNDSGLVFMETGSQWNLVATQNSGVAQDLTPFLSVKAI